MMSWKILTEIKAGNVPAVESVTHCEGEAKIFLKNEREREATENG